MQYRAYQQPAWRLALAQRVVAAKLVNQQRFVDRLLRQRPDRRSVLTKARGRIVALKEKVNGTADLDVLRGHEGAAASAYFDAYAAVLPPRLGFKGRNRRPPKDPVNACLSLAYTLAHADAVHAAHIAGLDPAVGMLHDHAWGRPSLASDLIEPLRPHIDAWVWALFRDRKIDLDHFGNEGEASLLKKSGRQRFYGEWEQRAPVLRRWLRQASYALLRQLEEQGDGTAAIR